MSQALTEIRPGIPTMISLPPSLQLQRKMPEETTESGSAVETVMEEEQYSDLEHAGP